jgi:hypothetical protein
VRRDANVVGAPYRQFYGKYRGKVLDNVDPMELGRLLAEVAAVPGASGNWCMPCVPYAGIQVGFFNMPPIGANVWIEFEGGDPMRPIWSGCFWGEGELPVEFAETPLMHLWKTEFITVQLDDTPEEGGIKIICTPPAVNTPLSMFFNSEGIFINAPPAIITMITEEGITLTFPPGVISMTEAAIESAIPATTVTLTEEAIAIETPAMEVLTEAEFSVEAGADLTLAAGAAAEVTAGADLALTGGAAAELTGGADVAITAGGAMELTAPALEITAATNVVPALLIDGQPPLII